MEHIHEGGCLCGAIRYRTTAEPLLVNVCHCTFCQRSTGTAFLVEPVFRKSDVVLTGEEPRTYDHRSDESGKRVTLKFCGTCGTTLLLDAERFPEILAIWGGTFDDPNWFERAPGKCQHIFTRSAQRGVVLPPDLDLYELHRMTLDGTPNTPIVRAHATVVEREN